jgi:hypothetical protein
VTLVGFIGRRTFLLLDPISALVTASPFKDAAGSKTAVGCGTLEALPCPQESLPVRFLTSRNCSTEHVPHDMNLKLMQSACLLRGGLAAALRCGAVRLVSAATATPTQTSRRLPIGRRIPLPVWRVSMGKHPSQMYEAKAMRFHILNENLAPLAEERMY